MKIYIPETGSTYEGTPEALSAVAAAVYHEPAYKHIPQDRGYNRLPWPFNIKLPTMGAPGFGG